MTAAPEAAADPQVPGEIRVLLTKEQSQALADHFTFVLDQFKNQSRGTDTRWSLAAQVWDHGGARARNRSSYTGKYGQIVVVCIPRERAFLVSPDGYAQVKADRAERDALRAVLTEIVREFRATYEASNDGGTWKGAAQIDARVMERAERLVSK